MVTFWRVSARQTSERREQPSVPHRVTTQSSAQYEQALGQQPPAPSLRTAVLSAKSAPASNRDRGDGRRRWTLVLLSLPLALVNVLGVAYYTSPPGARVRHPWHALLRPSGAVGQSAGIVAFLIFVFLWLYPLRKKWKRLAFTGSV